MVRCAAPRAAAPLSVGAGTNRDSVVGDYVYLNWGVSDDTVRQS